MMQTAELFCGTKSFSKVMAKYGHNTYTIDINPQFKPDICDDILDISLGHFDFIWASPPCQAFSVASIGANWKGGHRAYIPKTDNARLGLKLLNQTIRIISESKPTYWCIENPRGMMRKVIDKMFKQYDIKDYRRITICYCQYGDTRMKPTDIWTNIQGWKGKMCRNGSKDHMAAPRGAKTGTQGLKGSINRSVIPPAVFEEMLKIIL